MTPDTVSPPTDGHPTPDTVSPLPPTRCHPNQKVTKLNSVSADARPTHTFEDFWREHPRTATSRRSTAQDAFDRAVASGADPAHIVASARAYAEEQRGNASQYLAHAAAWLDARRWDDYPPPDPDADRADAIALARKMAKSPITSVSDTGRQMLRRLGESAA